LAGFLHQHRFALRRLHSLMGVFFGGYIIVHLLINATLLQASFPWLFGKAEADVYQAQVTQIHSLPFLIAIEIFFIILPITFHAVYGILVAISGRSNVSDYGYAKNWAYTLQRATSWVLLLFIAFHVLSFKGFTPFLFGGALTFNAEYATQTAINHMHAAWWIGWVVYPIGILAATFHLSNGFWTAGITWGLTITAASQRIWGVACVGLFLFTTACGFGSLASTLAAEPVDLGVLQEDYDRIDGAAPSISNEAAAEGSELMNDLTD
jgi:succinate dehydrogenase / fumarate reductase cytochrome b subunit